MGLIFFAFANDHQNPLPTLSQEYNQVFDALVARSKLGHFNIHREAYVTPAIVAKRLIEFRDEIEIFHYSGHANRDTLLLDGEAANSRGIVGLLDQSPNLRLVVLNGCSTEQQAALLVALKSKPVVVATSSPVEDFAATQFAISFYQSLSQYNNITDSFQLALAAAQMKKKSPISVVSTRDIVSSVNPSSKAVWGLFHPTGHELLLEWALPSNFQAVSTFIPNSILLEKLLEEFALHSKNIQQLYELEIEGIKVSLLKKRRAILESLPYPVSEHLRKLLVEKEPDSTQVFFDKLSLDRLNQLISTYQSIIEWPIYIMLAQFWDSLIVKKNTINLSTEQYNLIRNYLCSSARERSKSLVFELIPVLIKIFQDNSISLFVKEIQDMGPEFEQNSELHQACLFFESIASKKGIGEKLAQSLCIEAEEKLAYVIGKFSFLISYTLISVKNIRVLKNRDEALPKFRHRLLELIQRFVGLEPSLYDSESILDNSSIHLRKEENGKSVSLNLSPFIIDVNAFDDTAHLAKLYYFDSYQKDVDACIYRHIYKPKDFPILVKAKARPGEDKNWQLKIFYQQFDRLSQLLFSQPLTQL